MKYETGEIRRKVLGNEAETGRNRKRRGKTVEAEPE